MDPGGNDNTGRRKTSKYFPNDKGQEIEEISGKRKAHKEDTELKPPPQKKQHLVNEKDDDDFVSSKTGTSTTPSKKLKSVSGRGVVKKTEDESDEEDMHKNQSKSRGRGSRGRGASKGESIGRIMDVDKSDEDDIKNQSKGRGRGRGASKGEVVARNMDIVDNEEDDDEEDKNLLEEAVVEELPLLLEEVEAGVDGVDLQILVKGKILHTKEKRKSLKVLLLV